MTSTRARLSLDISSKAKESLVEIADRYGLTLTDATARLIAIGKYVLDAQESGQDVCVNKHLTRFPM
jgi:hypothetical protein